MGLGLLAKPLEILSKALSLEVEPLRMINLKNKWENSSFTLSQQRAFLRPLTQMKSNTHLLNF